ncbi:hypothetical protein AAE478_008115 [Parahypoxylon ruwenzoriense]
MGIFLGCFVHRNCTAECPQGCKSYAAIRVPLGLLNPERGGPGDRPVAQSIKEEVYRHINDHKLKCIHSKGRVYVNVATAAVIWKDLGCGNNLMKLPNNVAKMQLELVEFRYNIDHLCIEFTTSNSRDEVSRALAPQRGAASNGVSDSSTLGPCTCQRRRQPPGGFDASSVSQGNLSSREDAESWDGTASCEENWGSGCAGCSGE